MVVFDRLGNPIIESEVVIPYELALGATWSRFFDGLKEKRVLATKCQGCQRVLVPARAFCPRCFMDMEEWLEVPAEGIVEGWVLVNYNYFGMPTKAPFISALIRLDGTDCGFIHLLGGIEMDDIESARKHIWNGLRVKAVWNEARAGHIMDIKYFTPAA